MTDKRNIKQISPDFEIQKGDIIDKVKGDKIKETETVFNYASIGFSLITPILLGVFLGLYLDKVFKTKPILTLVFILFGMIASVYNLWKAAK